VLSVLSPAPTGYGAVVLADHPLAYWRLDEANGALVAYDRVGGHNGSYSNVTLGLPGYNQFDPDTAARFGPETNSFVGNIEGLSFSSTSTNAVFSLECWVKGGAQLPRDVGIITIGTETLGEQFDLLSEGDSGGAYRFFVRDFTGTASANGFTPLSPNNTWQHLTAVYEGPAFQLRLYVNGIQVGSGIAPPNGLSGAAHPVAIGSRRSLTGSGPYDSNFNGMIDEVAIYDYALSADQVLAHYSAGTARLALRPIANQLELTWPGGVLQSAPEPNGPYDDITNAISPHRITPSNGGSFYRVKIR
jgi:hypothetical protein